MTHPEPSPTAVVQHATGHCRLLIADHLSARARRASVSEQERLLGEVWEWIVSLLDSKFIDGLMHAVTTVPFDRYDSLMRFFTVDAKARNAPHAGDGFLPPITRIGAAYLFSPSIVRATLSTRNILYAANKQDATLFSRSIANEMEPALIEAAMTIFRRLPKLTVVPNVRWAKGEMDILVFSPEENAALHVQAKAAIPPEGARMTKAMEGRIAEAISQLGSLRALPGEDADKLISGALHRDVRGVTIYDVVLTSSCFGTAPIWERMENMGALNLALLTAVVANYLRESEPRPVARLAAAAAELLGKWCADVTHGWSTESATIGGITLSVPSLELDGEALRGIRQASG